MKEVWYSKDRFAYVVNFWGSKPVQDPYGDYRHCVENEKKHLFEIAVSAFEGLFNFKPEERTYGVVPTQQLKQEDCVR